MSGPMDAGMDLNIHETWSRNTQGYNLKTQNVKTLARERTSLWIGSGARPRAPSLSHTRRCM